MRIRQAFRLVALTCAAVAFAASSATAGDPPNWRGRASGTTRPVADTGVDVDVFAGKSTHLGRFTGAGFHMLDPNDFTFVGYAIWKAANGDYLFVTYTGQLVGPTVDPAFPFGFVAELRAVCGTGRLARARGQAAMTGAFSGVPGNLYFDIEGTLDLNRK
jgi:hypothetical protein